jgi:hypothetical protein
MTNLEPNDWQYAEPHDNVDTYIELGSKITSVASPEQLDRLFWNLISMLHWLCSIMPDHRRAALPPATKAAMEVVAQTVTKAG